MAKHEYLVAKAVIVRDGNVLLLRQSEDSATNNSGFYHPPGGILEDGESAEDALAREVREETGLTVRIIRPIGTADWYATMHSQDAHFTGTFFECELEGDTPIRLDYENDSGAWFSLADITHVLVAEPSLSVVRDHLAAKAVSSDKPRG